MANEGRDFTETEGDSAVAGPFNDRAALEGLKDAFRKIDDSIAAPAIHYRRD